MISEEDKNNLLAKWLEGSLSNEQVEELKTYYDLDILKKSVDHISNFTSPPYNPEKEWSQLSEKISGPGKSIKQRSITGRRLWISISIAATIALLVGSFFWLRTSSFITIEGHGEQVVVHTLPDQSKVTLIDVGHIKYNQKTWQSNRIIELKGDAFFDVTDGSAFMVKAEFGDIEVLGTRFSVVSEEEQNIIKCFEGSVLVSNLKDATIILKPGEGVVIDARERILAIRTVLSTAPWMTNETKFTDTDIQTIGQMLEEIFTCQVIMTDSIKKKCSGVIIHNDLSTSLKLICDPLDLNYDIINQKEIRIYE